MDFNVWLKRFQKKRGTLNSNHKEGCKLWETKLEACSVLSLLILNSKTKFGATEFGDISAKLLS